MHGVGGIGQDHQRIAALVMLRVEAGKRRRRFSIEDVFEQIEDRAAPGEAQHFEDGGRGQMALAKRKRLIQQG